MAFAEPRVHRPVLLVEDDPDVTHLITLLLKRDGYEVIPAANGAEALLRLSDGLQPGVILLDYHMPVMDGGVFRREQLARGLQAEVPVILYSSATIQGDELRVQETFAGEEMNIQSVVQAVGRLRL